MSNMTAREQMMLELINRARMDPAGEARRLGISLNEGVPKGDKISNAPKQVLAGDDDLIQAARGHSKWMNDTDKFQHDEGTKDPGDRMGNAGYDFPKGSTWGENISARFQSNAISNAQRTQLIIQQHADLFIDKGYQDRGHRTNIMSDDFQEIGIGQNIGRYKDGGHNWHSSMVTQDFARSGTDKIFITGVVYNDTVKKDNFFSVGEQVAGKAIDGGSADDTTGQGGGYELQYSSGGTKTVDFGGGISVDVALGATSLKLDLVNGDEIWTNATLTSISSTVDEIHLLGIGNADLTGADTGQDMFANAGKNVFEGNGGADGFVFAKGTTGKTETKADTIADFSHGEGDMIDLKPWDANSKKSGNQDFDFIGTQNFHGKAGELRYLTDGGDTWIQADTNGDKKVDLMIHLDGSIALVEGDFNL